MVGRPYSYGAAGALYTRQGSWKPGCGHSVENRARDWRISRLATSAGND